MRFHHLTLLALSPIASAAQVCTVPDAFEPNDTCARAAALPFGVTSGLTLTAGDVDRYAVSVPPGARLTAVLSFQIGPALPPFFTALDEDCTRIVATAGSVAGTTVVFDNVFPAPRELVLYLDAGPTQDCAEYTLDVTLAGSTDPCLGLVGDVFEDSDSCSQAAPLGPGAVFGLRAEFPDDDWYRLTIPAQTRLEVRGTYSSATTAVVAWLYEDDCALLEGLGPFTPVPAPSILDVGTTIDIPNAVDRTLEETNAGASDRDVLLRISADPSFVTLCMDYDLEVTLFPLDCASGSDPLDDLSNCAQPGIPVGPGTYEDLFVSVSDPDDYTLVLPAGTALTAVASFAPAEGNLDLRLTRGCTQAVGTVTDLVTMEQVTYTAGQDEVLTLQAFVGSPSNSDCLSYRLDLALAYPPNATPAPLCFGASLVTPCPCSNTSSAGGCTNSTGRGAILVDNGGAFVQGLDSLALWMRLGPPDSFAVLVSADNALPGASPGSGIQAFDGLRCVGGNLRRHGGRATDSDGNTGVWGFGGNPIGGLHAQGGWAFGRTTFFQVFYRDTIFGACGTGQNTTNALRVRAVP